MQSRPAVSRSGDSIVCRWRDQRPIVSNYRLIGSSYQSVETVLQIERLGNVPGRIL